MSNITIYDEFTSFITDLIELLKEDWIKFKLFIKKNKNYCLWILILFITLQFTDLLNLGASWNRYCSKNEGKTNNNHNLKHNQIQMGGDGGPAAPAAPEGKPDKATAKAEKAQAKAEKKEDKKAQKDQDKANKGGAPSPGLSEGINKVTSMVSGMFVIISFILVVVGIISIPIIVFIVITYTILKYMLSNVSLL
jgi:hypothetical protein